MLPLRIYDVERHNKRLLDDCMRLSDKNHYAKGESEWICCTFLDSLERDRGATRERANYGRPQPPQEAHRGVQAQIHTVLVHSLQPAEDALHVGAQEALRVGDGAVVVALGCVVYDGVVVGG